MAQRFLHSRAAILAAISLSLLGGCTNSAPPAAASGSSGGSGSQDATTSSTVPSVSAKPVGSSLGGYTPPSVTGLALDSLSGCGLSALEAATAIGSQGIKSDAFNYSGTTDGVSYVLSVSGSLQLTGSLSAVTTAAQFTLLQATPPTAQTKAAKDIAQDVNGTITATVADPASWNTLFAASSWQGLHCSTLPVSQLTLATQTKTTTVSFQPALPYNIIPEISAERFALEFPKARTFAVTATILSTNNQSASSGQTQNGTVTITPVTASGTATDNAGNPVQVIADYGYRIDNNFGTSTSIYGLYSSASYYVKDGKITLAIINTGIANAPDVLFTAN